MRRTVDFFDKRLTETFLQITHKQQRKTVINRVSVIFNQRNTLIGQRSCYITFVRLRVTAKKFGKHGKPFVDPNRGSLCFSAIDQCVKKRHVLKLVHQRCCQIDFVLLKFGKIQSVNVENIAVIGTGFTFILIDGVKISENRFLRFGNHVNQLSVAVGIAFAPEFFAHQRQFLFQFACQIIKVLLRNGRGFFFHIKNRISGDFTANGFGLFHIRTGKNPKLSGFSDGRAGGGLQSAGGNRRNAVFQQGGFALPQPAVKGGGRRSSGFFRRKNRR